MPFSASFVWTKMAAESGEALAAIILRKNFERQLGGGLFAWGIGNALGIGVDALAREIREPDVVFSAMTSKPKVIDVMPSSVLLWTAYEGTDGIAHPLPDHLFITSRGHVATGVKSRHYALFCHSDAPLAVREPPAESVFPATLRNFLTDRQLGASQVTAVVRCTSDQPVDAKAYPVAFTAKLASPFYGKLLAPRVITASEVADMMAAQRAGVAAWGDFVRQARQSAPPTVMIPE